jgi:hypothetical protein
LLEHVSHLPEPLTGNEQPLDKGCFMPAMSCVRKYSSTTICGLPLYSIAVGPDMEKGEVRGRARGVIAIGDVATGWLAISGVAKGIVAFGGLALGLVSFGGLSLGGLAVGGAALGGIALGGAAVGVVAIGGFAVGYYACGGEALGKFVLSVAKRSPEAVEFFKSWFPRP